MALQTYIDPATGRPVAANTLTPTTPEDPANISGLSGRELQRALIQNITDANNIVTLQTRNPIYFTDEGGVADWTGVKGSDNTAAIAAATDNSAAFIAVQEKAMDENRPLVINGRFYCQAYALVDVTADLEIIGLPGSELYFDPPNPNTEAWRIINLYSTGLTLSANVDRGDYILPFTDASDLNVGDSITLLSDEVFDPNSGGFNAKKCDTFEIVSITGNNVEVNGRCTFPYDIGAETVTIRVYTRRSLTMTGVNIRCDENVRAFSVLCAIIGMRCKITNCTLDAWNGLRNIDGFTFLDTPFTEIIGDHAESVRYAHLANQSRHYYVIRSIGSNCRHLADCATHTADILYRECVTTGCNTGLTTHGCFDLKIRDCICINEEGGMPSPRAWGTDIDGYFVRQDPDSAYTQLHTYWGHPSYTGVAAAYQYYFDLYDVTLRRVDWVANAATGGAFNGINVARCRRLIVDNCHTHAIGTASSIKQIAITNSTIGTIHMTLANDNSHMQIVNTVFDGSLGPGYKTPFTKATRMTCVSCYFKNYDNTAGDGHFFELYSGGIDSHCQFISCIARAAEQQSGIAFQSLVNSAIPDAYSVLSFMWCDIDVVTSPATTGLTYETVSAGSPSISGTPAVGEFCTWLNATTVQSDPSFKVAGSNFRIADSGGTLELVNSAVSVSRNGNDMRLNFFGDSGDGVEFYDIDGAALLASVGKNLRLYSGTYYRQSDPSLTATGSDQVGALDLSAVTDWYKITAGAVDTGVELPALTEGMTKRVANATATNKKVYPNGTENFIQGGAVLGAGASFDLAAYSDVVITCYQTGQGIVK